MSYVRCKECGAEYGGTELFYQCPDCDAFESFELIKQEKKRLKRIEDDKKRRANWE